MLREINDRAALDILLREGPLTRADLEELVGLSKPATAQLLARLERDGMVVRDGVRNGARGPRAQLWRVAGSVAHVAAVDLTPHGAEFVIADITGRELAEHRAHLPIAAGSDVVGAFTAALTDAAAVAGRTLADLRHVVVGTPGALDPRTGRLESAPHLPGWCGFDLRGRLRDALGTPVTVENDVNLVALQELAAAEATGVRDFVLVWLDEGVGGAVVLDGRLRRGASGAGGEVDWLRVPDPAAADTGIGRSGTRWGDLVDSPAIVALATAHGMSADTGWAAVGAAVEAGEGGQGFLTDLARRIAVGVAGVVSVVDPELVLLCGEVTKVGGTVLADLVAGELHRLVVPRTPVGLTTVPGNAVRAGALHSALATARVDVFGLASPAGPVPYRSRSVDAPLGRAHALHDPHRTP
ncbi:ROK family transcriptional regulator [Amycolatopsis arida]|uniref:ROK family transcriptional regulator n=1 Tax=Amycolatopsis arida TaxID=587909 RepID=UPI000B86530D|nr:ROK family transcriptional regulator [Amycolatopsis arida]